MLHPSRFISSNVKPSPHDGLERIGILLQTALTLLVIKPRSRFRCVRDKYASISECPPIIEFLADYDALAEVDTITLRACRDASQSYCWPAHYQLQLHVDRYPPLAILCIWKYVIIAWYGVHL